MAQTKLALLLCVLFLYSCGKPGYEWRSVPMDGTRTGCTAVRGEDVEKALGYFEEDGTYVSPNGNRHESSSAAAKVASIVHQSQPKMAWVKEVVAYSAEEMPVLKQETTLSNWFVDLLMAKVSSLSGRKVDVGICNFGGIRVDMPAGEVVLDDLLSMFPFKNKLAYLELRGRELRRIFETMAATKFAALGGVRLSVDNGVLTELLIGGKAVEDDKMYSVATVSYLLSGGDYFSFADNAHVVKVYDVIVIDAVLEHVKGLTAQGKMIIPPTDVRVTIKR